MRRTSSIDLYTDSVMDSSSRQRTAILVRARGVVGTLTTLLRSAAVLVFLALLLWAFARVGLREFARVFATDGRTELVVMHWSGGGGQEEDAIVDSSLQEFEAANPSLRVRRINAGGAGDFYTKLQTMTAAGDPPDVFYVGAERVPAFAALGLLLPLDEFVASDGVAPRLNLADFYPHTVEAFRYDAERSELGVGPLWGIPKDFTTVGFYINVDLFHRAGIALPSDDWTWDEFAAAARAIGALKGVDAGAVFVTWPMMVRAYLRTEGLDVHDMTDSAMIATLERLRSWRHDETKTILRTSANIAEDSLFLGGRIGMAGPFGRWVVPSYRTIKSSADGGFEWDFRQLPHGAVRSNTIATVSWSIARATEHPQEAWRLVQWLVSPASQAAQARLGLAIPTIRSVATSEAFADPAQAPANDRGFLASAETARVVEWPEDPQFEGLLGSRLDQALKTGALSAAAASANFVRDWAAVSNSPLSHRRGARVDWSALAAIGAAALALAALYLYWPSVRGGNRNERAGMLLASPWIIGFALFMAIPVAMSLVLAFSSWSGVSELGSAEYVGLANFEQLLSDDIRFRASLRVTIIYALIAVPCGQLLALGLAMLLHTRVRPQRLFRAAWYLPSVVAGVGAAVLWQWVFDTQHGLLNGMLSAIGIDGPDWLGRDADVAGAPAFALMSLWYVGGSMMIYLAGLQQVPADLIEASAIDGAGAWSRFRRVTLPMLSPVILFNMLMAVIASFQVFTQAFIMGGGKSGDDTLFYVLYLYDQGFVNYRMGYASALAWLLLLAVLVMTGIILRSSSRFVYYEGLKL